MQGEHVARELPSCDAVPPADTVWDTLLLDVRSTKLAHQWFHVI